MIVYLLKVYRDRYAINTIMVLKECKILELINVMKCSEESKCLIIIRFFLRQNDKKVLSGMRGLLF